MSAVDGPAGGGRRSLPGAVVLGLGVVIIAVLAGVGFGPVPIAPGRLVLEFLDQIPFLSTPSGLTPTERAIVWSLRLPRVTLAVLVGALLATSGAAYQGVFRNPLADPYLLGVASGAGLGAIVAFVSGWARGGLLAVPICAFVGALAASGVTYLLGAVGPRATPTTLILAGVAVAAMLGAGQTLLLQFYPESLREAYSWTLGRLTVAGWSEVAVLMPYAVLSLVVLAAHGRVLDVLQVGDDEATTLGINPRTARLVVLVAASLGTAAAVSFSGLIGFVGLIVPHVVRLLAGPSYRRVVVLSMLFGAGFLVLADVVARLVLAPAELPIGVVTALCGAPFFLGLLRAARWGQR